MQRVCVSSSSPLDAISSVSVSCVLCPVSCSSCLCILYAHREQTTRAPCMMRTTVHVYAAPACSPLRNRQCSAVPVRVPSPKSQPGQQCTQQGISADWLSRGLHQCLSCRVVIWSSGLESARSKPRCVRHVRATLGSEHNTPSPK